MLSVYDDAHRAPIEYSDSDESTSDSPPVPLTPGPLDPQHCTVAGRGFAGGAAGSPLSLTVFSKDSNGIRITEGGAVVVVFLENNTGECVIQVDAVDKKDGTYTATYTAPSRGDYKLCITMDGISIGGSPFPVFFSPPTMTETISAMLMATRMGSSPEAALNMAADGVEVLQGDAIDRCLCVSNIALNIKEEQIKQLFQYCGKVTNVTFISEAREAALVEFETALEAGCAIGLNGVSVGERSLTVKLAKAVITGKDQPPSVESIASEQYNALASATQNAHHLVMQLASLRAIARTALLPAIQAEERKYEGRAQALNAAAEISKKLGYEQSEHFLVPEPLPTDVNEVQKLVFDKQKLGGPRHYNGRGRFARQRHRSRSRSPLPFHKRFHRRVYSPPRQRRHRSQSKERRHRHRSKSKDRSLRHRSRSKDRSTRNHRKERKLEDKKIDRSEDKRTELSAEPERSFNKKRDRGHVDKSDRLMEKKRERSPYRKRDHRGIKHRESAMDKVEKGTKSDI